MDSGFSATAGSVPGAASRVDHLGVIGRHRWLVILVVGWSIGLAAVYSFTRPTIYTAEAAILVRPAVTSIDSSQGDVNPETESQVVHSTTVARLAAAHMEEHPPIATMLANLAVDVPENTEILQLLYSARDAGLAKRGADAFARAYLEFRQQEAEGRAAERVATFQGELDDTLIPQIEELRTQLQDPLISATEESVARNRLRDLTAQRRIVENQLLLAQNVIIDPGEIIASPLVPRSPSSPNHTLDLALGAIIGLGLAFGIAYIRDRGDSGFKSAAALEDFLGVPVLAVIPSFRDEPSPRRDPVSLYRSNGPISEGYRTLRTAVLARASRSRLVTIVVTSSISGEGKSTTSSMLAIALADSGKRVVLICGDLRRPSADLSLSVDARPGLTDVLAGRLESVRDVMQESAIPNLLVVPSGWTAADRDPSALLGSDRMHKVLEECGSSADFILIDSPATLAVTDALVLAPLADGVLFVASARGTSPQMIEFAKVQLERMGANIVGGVLVGLRRPVGLDRTYYLRPGSLPSSRQQAVSTRPRRDRIRDGVATLLRPERLPPGDPALPGAPQPVVVADDALAAPPRTDVSSVSAPRGETTLPRAVATPRADEPEGTPATAVGPPSPHEATSSDVAASVARTAEDPAIVGDPVLEAAPSIEPSRQPGPRPITKRKKPPVTNQPTEKSETQAEHESGTTRQAAEAEEARKAEEVAAQKEREAEEARKAEEVAAQKERASETAPKKRATDEARKKKPAARSDQKGRAAEETRRPQKAGAREEQDEATPGDEQVEEERIAVVENDVLALGESRTRRP